jgi:hypothetical protein
LALRYSILGHDEKAELGLAWLGLAWLGLAWLGLAWLGLAWLGLAWLGLRIVADFVIKIKPFRENFSRILLRGIAR